MSTIADIPVIVDKDIPATAPTELGKMLKRLADAARVTHRQYGESCWSPTRQRLMDAEEHFRKAAERHVGPCLYFVPTTTWLANGVTRRSARWSIISSPKTLLRVGNFTA